MSATRTAPTPRTAVLVGNPAPRSRTRSIAELVATVVGEVDPGHPVVDLAELGDHILDPGARETVTSADLLVVATPSYKGSITGLLKCFLDGLAPDALSGTAVVPVVVAGSERHAVVTDQHLRWVLGEVGARLPVRSVVLTERQLDEALDHVERWRAGEGAALVAQVGALESALEVSA